MPFVVKRKLNNTRTNKKRKSLVQPHKTKDSASKKQKIIDDDEEITSDEETLGNNLPIKKDEDFNEAEEIETAAEKKYRLAVQYLEERKQIAADLEDVADVEKTVEQQLKEEVLEAAGALQRNIGDSLDLSDDTKFSLFRNGNQTRAVTGLAVSSDGQFIYSCSKDPSIVKWNIEGQRVSHLKRHKRVDTPMYVKHTTDITCIAISSDDKYLATGDKAGIIHVWKGKDLTHLAELKKHQKAVTGIAFQKGTDTMFSCSNDRSVCVWKMSLMAFVDRIFGHDHLVTGIDSHVKESCITSGATDQLAIIYMMEEEKQLKFTSSHSSVDGVKFINEKTFVTYGQEGGLCLWSNTKKKPVYTMEPAHGNDPETRSAHWLTAVGTLANSDLVASGSMDGNIRLWQVTPDAKRLNLLKKIPIEGIINAIAFTPTGSHLIASFSNEHKAGRWFHLKSVRNGIAVLPLKRKSL